MSIMPRHLRPGGRVIIHVGVMNRSPRPICPLLRIWVVSPDGGQHQIFSQHLLVFPNYCEEDTLVERRKRMTNIYEVFPVPDEAQLGCYRVKVENFADGNLIYSDTVETDFFFVERLELSKVTALNGSVHAMVRNESPEPVRAVVYELEAGSPDGAHSSREVILGPETETTVTVLSHSGFLAYADTVLPLGPSDSPVCVRNQQFFWRPEDDATVFVLDPRCGYKRDFFLSGRARDLWLAAGGTARRCDLRTGDAADLYDVMVEKELLVEF
jgi:hypothetical protein